MGLVEGDVQRISFSNSSLLFTLMFRILTFKWETLIDYFFLILISVLFIRVNLLFKLIK